MDSRLVAWGRAVKTRRRGGPPPLWLFTDAERMADVEAAVAGLPRGLCGVVFRHDGVPGRAALLRGVARICRQRRLVLVVAGTPSGLAGVGSHLRSGPGAARAAMRGRRVTTAAAHGVAGLVRARRAGAGLAFLSPAYPTASHPGAPALGPVRWARQARQAGLACLALGGITGATAMRLPRWTAGIGAIGALLPGSGDRCARSATVFRDCHGKGV